MSHYKKALLRNWTSGNSDEEDTREERSRGEPEKMNGAHRGTSFVHEIEDDDLEFAATTNERTPNALDEPMDISETVDARREHFGESQPISRPVVTTQKELTSCSTLQKHGDVEAIDLSSSRVPETSRSSSTDSDGGEPLNDGPGNRLSLYGIDHKIIVRAEMEILDKEIKKRNLTPEQEKIIKNERRKGKNRLAAQNSRKRKNDQVYQLRQQRQRNDQIILEEQQEYEKARAQKRRWQELVQQLSCHLERWEVQISSGQEKRMPQ